MATLMARHGSPELVARVRTYARARALSTSQAIGDLLTIALDHLDARSAGGHAVHRSRSEAERSLTGRRLAMARWKRG